MKSTTRKAQTKTTRATAEGTTRYAARFAGGFEDDFYRPLDRDLRLSSIGIGTYLGECTDADDARYRATIGRAIERGINLIDTAINYRCQRSERSVGHALANALRSGRVARDEIVLCTKGGYIPLDGSAPDDRFEYQRYVQREYIDRRILTPDDIVAGGHSLAPAFLADQLRRSLANLRVHAVDVYYIHNPEQQLDAIAPSELDARLRAAFALLEEQCAAGRIGRYGCATWNGFRVSPEEHGHLSLARLVALAQEVAGDSHHFRVVQLPVSLALAEAVRAPTQKMPGGERIPLLQAAAELGISVVTSGTLLQGKLTAGLPEQIRDTLPGYDTDAQRAIAFVRALPVISSALVGMKREEWVEENLKGGAKKEL
ncbi:MAG: aldo/keto reductase [Gemmatimonadota bacterium]|nr:aldo/keto reductase [Gemmatimonadota bacterium]